MSVLKLDNGYNSQTGLTRYIPDIRTPEACNFEWQKTIYRQMWTSDVNTPSQIKFDGYQTELQWMRGDGWMVNYSRLGTNHSPTIYNIYVDFN